MAGSSASDEPKICTILTISLAEFQQLNFDRIFPNLAENGLLDKEVVNVMKSRTASEKSSVLKAILEAKDEKDFQTFLKIVADEDENSSFYKPTEEFLAMVKDSQSASDYSDKKKTESIQPNVGRL